MENKTFKTDVMKLAAYLTLRGYNYSIEPTENKKEIEFVFVDHDGKIRDVESAYWTESVSINISTYNIMVDRLRDRIKAVLEAARLRKENEEGKK